MEEDSITQNQTDSGNLCDKIVRYYTCFGSSLLKGMPYAFCGALLLTGGDICATLLTRSMAPLAVLAMFSSISSAISLLIAVAVKVPLPNLRTDLLILLMCNVAGCACRVFLMFAISRLPVGDAISLFYTNPVFTAFFGWVLLKQPLKISDVIFSFTCILGVVFVTRPSFIFSQLIDGAPETDTVGIIFAVGSAIWCALSFIAIRKLSDLGVHCGVIIVTTRWTVFIVTALLCTVLGEWNLPEPLYYTVFVPLYATCNLLAALSVFSAFAKERAVYVTVILTSEIILVYIFQSVTIGAVPHWLTLAGAFVVMVSCVAMAFGENMDVDN